MKRLTHFVPCDGEAHRNPHVDNCWGCAPRWGVVEVPVEFPTLLAFRAAQPCRHCALDGLTKSIAQCDAELALTEAVRK